MTRPPKKKGDNQPEGDPRRGDELLKRMLQTKPKPHDKMVAERKANQRGKQGKSSK